MKNKPIIGITPDYSYDKRRFILSEDYTNAIMQAGGIPVMLTPTEIFPDFADGILFSGGGDVDPLLFNEEPIRESGEISPLRDNFELWLCKEAFLRQIPLLGICRGMQILNIAANGSIYQDIAVQTDTTLKHNQNAPRFYGTHTVTPTPDSILGKLWQEEKTTVNSFHHQAINTLGKGFFVAAYSSDGLIEAIEQKAMPFVLGVQWHPEAMQQEKQKAVFTYFIKTATEYKDRRI